MIGKVFVFGSNLEGRHGAGAALEARKKWGAVYGLPVGWQGDSYAIPTKETPYKSLPLKKIEQYVEDFLEVARDNPYHQFILTPIGCGLAGHSQKDIAPMFYNATGNIVLPKLFEDFLFPEKEI